MAQHAPFVPNRTNVNLDAIALNSSRATMLIMYWLELAFAFEDDLLIQDYLIGFDIGGTKCAVILGKVNGLDVEILDRFAFATQTPKGPEYALVHLEESAQNLVKSHGLTFDQIRAIGISCGGPLDSKLGTVLGPPNLPGWDCIPITDRFEAALGVPAKLQNDANACALAEWKWGAGRGSRNMIFLTFGTGLGAGLILNGELYSGASDLAGEVGHVRLADDGPEGYGKRGSFEGFCSGGGIANLARQVVVECWSRGESITFCMNETELSGLSALKIADAANAGDLVALYIWDTVGKRLGQGLSMLIDILNPEVIVIGSIFARQRDLLWPAAKKVIMEEAIPSVANACRIVPAELGEAIGDYASLSVAI